MRNAFGRMIGTDGSGQPIASLATAPSGTEEALVVRNIPSGTQTVSGTVTSTPSGVQHVIIDSAPVLAVDLPSFSRADTYTTTGSGGTVDVHTTPTQTYAILVKGTGGVASLWDVRLEGSLDGTYFTQIIQHTNTTGDGVTLYSGATLSPSLYFRSRCAGLTLGGDTNIVVTILGI